LGGCYLCATFGEIDQEMRLTGESAHRQTDRQTDGQADTRSDRDKLNL